MHIKKIFNNNVAIVIDRGLEKIVMGKGVGFNKVYGDDVDELIIEKIFVADENHYYEEISSFFDKVPQNVIEATLSIIEEGTSVLGKHITGNMLIPLADHIDFAITRLKENIEIQYPLLWEMKRLYPEEMNFAEKCIDKIETATDVSLPISEAVPIAMHFVNAKYNTSDVKEAFEMTTLVNKVIDVIRYFYFIDLDESSLFYARFVTHLRYFILRHMSGEKLTEEDDVLYDVVKNKYPKAFDCSQKIRDILETSMGWTISNSEVLYLSLHIHRLTMER